MFKGPLNGILTKLSALTRLHNKGMVLVNLNLVVDKGVGTSVGNDPRQQRGGSPNWCRVKALHKTRVSKCKWVRSGGGRREGERERKKKEDIIGGP